MSTENTTTHTTVQQLVDQRLDAIDRALLGLLSRQDRLAAVAQIEARIREVISANAVNAADLTAPIQHPNVSEGWISSTKKRLSRLALSASVAGILALVLLLAAPVTYFAVEMFADFVGEVFAIGLLVAQAVAVAVGGAAAVALGLGALVSLHRHREKLAGRGWAIAGLCTGSPAMLLGGMALLIAGLQFGFGQFISVSDVSEEQVASAADPARGECDDSKENHPTADSVPSMTAEELQCGPVPPLDAETVKYARALLAVLSGEIRVPPQDTGAEHVAPDVTPRQPEVGARGSVPAPLAPSAVSPQSEAAPRAAVPSPTDPQSAPRLAQPAGSNPSPSAPPAQDTTAEIE